MPEEDVREIGISRRSFLRLTGTAGIGLTIGLTWLEDGVAAIPASEGYLLVDTRKCSGCNTCMLGCSLAHEGKANLSNSRIQVIQSSFMHFPNDLTLEQCRQCVSAVCIKSCPTGALSVDVNNGNVRRIDREKCIGCLQCLRTCPHIPSRIAWNSETQKALICDLCADTPFWNERGGPTGKQLYVELCPYGAISVTHRIPAQQGKKGYKVDISMI